jgi:hypothetical protein
MSAYNGGQDGDGGDVAHSLLSAAEQKQRGAEWNNTYGVE